MKGFPFKRHFVILVTGILLIGVMAMASVIPFLRGISLLTPHQVFAGTVPSMKLPWAIGDKDLHGQPIRFGGGPHGAPINFPCASNATRTIIRESGLDFDMVAGTSVLAVADGWVVFKGTVPGIEGQVLALDHGDGFMTQYWHLGEIDAALNTWVSQGAVIGKSGSPSGGDHLHLEFRYYRDPTLPKYNQDSSVGVPYPAHGLSIDGYTVRANIRTDTDTQTDTHLGWNYRGTLTRGVDQPPVKIPDHDQCGTTIQEWIGSGDGSGNPATIYSISNDHPAGGVVTGSTNVTPPLASVQVIQAWTANTNDIPTVSFNPGAQVILHARVNNTNSTTVTFNFIWQVTGPRQIVYLSTNITVPPGQTDVSPVATTIPTDAWQGHYFLRTQAIYNSLTSGMASDFTVTAHTAKIYIVLTWPGFRRDLDSHLWLPSAQQYHVWYRALGNVNSFPFAALNKDDTSVSGMETIDISKLQTGTYYYAVYNFGNTGQLAGSYTGVRVYQSGQLTQELQTPLTGGSGRWWDVLRINVSATHTVTITIKNTIVSTCPAPYGGCTSAASIK